MERVGVALLLWACILRLVCANQNRFDRNDIKSPTKTLLNGYEIPIVGFGTNFRKTLTAEKEAEAYAIAIKSGYRHFDTAWLYKNEKNLGRVLNKFFDQGEKREDFFITSKLPPVGMRASDVEVYLNRSLEDLGLDYVDMYLIHYPFGENRHDNLEVRYLGDGTVDLDMTTDHIAIWEAMEKQVRAGRIRSIGLSNFNKSQIQRIWDNAEIKPTNLQVEGNLYLQEEEIIKLCNELGIIVTAYNPLGPNDMSSDPTGLPIPMKNPVVQRIAKKYKRSTGQVLLRYIVQLGFIIVPKSKNLARMLENLGLFDFNIIDDDVNELKALDQHGKVRKFDGQLNHKGSFRHPEYPYSDLILKFNRNRK